MTAGAGLVADVDAVVGALELRLSLAVPPGETVAVLGPNGAGKTTLLRILAGLHPLRSGEVRLDGVVLDGEPERRPVGVVFQDLLLFPHLSCLENVAFGLRARGVAKATARSAATAWLERVGLGGRAGDRPGQLSGGEAQRVALARTLATSPRLLLLDEPLSALDATTRAAARRELRQVLAGHDGVRLLVTHDPLEAMALADRLVVLEQGRVVQEGTAAEISARPRSGYVADLVGVNLLRGVAGPDGAVASGGLTVHAADVEADSADGGGQREVFAVFHPRSVGLHRSRPEGSARNVWRGEATSIEVDAGRARVRVVVEGSGSVALVAEVTPAAVAELRLADGGTVWASLKATEVSVYAA